MQRKLTAVFGAALTVALLLPDSARAQSCPLNVPHVNGTWTILPYQMPINPISANLLPNGKVLIVAGSENDASNNSKGAESYRAAVWDPTGVTENSISVQELTYDVFCSGNAALPDGRSLIVGGTSSYSFTGENRASIFNPAPPASTYSPRACTTAAGTAPPPLLATDASWRCPVSLSQEVPARP
jgi:hypothetical protein